MRVLESEPRGVLARELHARMRFRGYSSLQVENVVGEMVDDGVATETYYDGVDGRRRWVELT